MVTIFLLATLSFLGYSILGGLIHDGLKYFLRFSGSASYFQRMRFAAVLRLVPEVERARFVNEFLDEYGARDISEVDSAIMLRSAVKIRSLFLPQQITSMIDSVISQPPITSSLVRREVALYQGSYHWLEATSGLPHMILSLIILIVSMLESSKVLAG